MADFETIRLAIAHFLQTPILINSYIHLDLWSVVHLLSGLGIFVVLSFFLNKRKSFFWLFIFLIAWELFEYTMYGIIKTSYFLPESIIDAVTDLWIGMLGGVITSILLLFKKSE